MLSYLPNFSFGILLDLFFSLLHLTTFFPPSFSPPLLGCYVSGLYLEGAAWNEEEACLRTQDPKVLVTELPIMQVIPVEASKLKLHNTFRTPGTENRRNHNKHFSLTAKRLSFCPSVHQHTSFHLARIALRFVF